MYAFLTRTFHEYKQNILSSRLCKTFEKEKAILPILPVSVITFFDYMTV